MTEIQLQGADGHIFEHRTWTLGANSRPPTDIETRKGFFTVSRYDPEADAWVYRKSHEAAPTPSWADAGKAQR